MPLLLEMTNCYSSSYLASFPIMEVEWRAAFCSLWMCYPSVYPARCWPHGSPGDLNKWISLLPGATVLPLRGQYRHAHHEQLCGHAECGCLGAGDECSSYDLCILQRSTWVATPFLLPTAAFCLRAPWRAAQDSSSHRLSPQMPALAVTCTGIWSLCREALSLPYQQVKINWKKYVQFSYNLRHISLYYC